MLQLGIIGCGRVTTMFHLNALDTLDNIRVHALSDVNRERLRKVASKTDAELLSTDYRDLICDSNITAVVINTPPKFHSEMVLGAIENGKHVLCEKPLAQEVEDLLNIKKLYESGHVEILPAHNYVFSPSLETAVNLLNKIGSLESINICFNNNLRTYRPHTNFRTLSNKGIIEDVLPHLLSVLFPFTGHDLDVIDTRWWCSSFDVCDNLVTSMKTKEGTDIKCSLSWTSIIPKFIINLIGDSGCISTELMWNPYTVKIKTNGISKTYKSRGLDWYMDLIRFRHPSFRNQYIHFEKLVKGLEKPRINVEDELAIVKIVEEVAKYTE